MNFIKKNLANAFTLANLFSGSLGVIYLLEGDYRATAVCIAVSLVLDFLDGFVARAVKANSELGAQLDSLADMVSFGLLPGVAMYKALEPFGTGIFGADFPFELKYVGLLITVFSCLRLAIFNLDEEQTYHFKGLNTPANSIMIFGLCFFLQEGGLSHLQFFENAAVLAAVSLVSSWLLVSPIKMIALKFKSMNLRDNYPKIALLAGILLLLLLFGWAGIPLAVLFYIFISLFFQRSL